MQEIAAIQIAFRWSDLVRRRAPGNSSSLEAADGASPRSVRGRIIVNRRNSRPERSLKRAGEGSAAPAPPAKPPAEKATAAAAATAAPPGGIAPACSASRSRGRSHAGIVIELGGTEILVYPDPAKREKGLSRLTRCHRYAGTETNVCPQKRIGEPGSSPICCFWAVAAARTPCDGPTPRERCSFYSAIVSGPGGVMLLRCSYPPITPARAEMQAEIRGLWKMWWKPRGKSVENCAAIASAGEQRLANLIAAHKRFRRAELAE